MFCDGSIFLDGAKWDIAFRRDESDRFSAVVLDSDCNLSGCHENKSTASDSISQNLCFHDADGDLICHIADSGDGMD